MSVYDQLFAMGVTPDQIQAFLEANPKDTDPHRLLTAFAPVPGYMDNVPGQPAGAEGSPEGTPSEGTAPAGSGDDFGAVPKRFDETYTTLERPDYLSGPYMPPTWDQSFTAPTQAQLEASPGYQSRLAAGLQTRERSASAQGSLLSGGTQKALERYGQDYAANEYGAEFGRAFQTYQQRYGEFGDAAGRGQLARQQNENAYQSDVNAGHNQYQTRYQSYLDAITNKRNSENDLWGRNMDLARNALTAAQIAR